MATAELENPPLNPGDNMTREEFLHLWALHPAIKKAELIGGIVYMPSFPGLWLDGNAFFNGDMARVLVKLQEGLASPEHQQFVELLAGRKKS